MTSKSPLLTVLIVAYNHEKSVAQSIKSVLAQKTDYPYILWIAEDASTDGTLNVCRQFAKKYPRRIRLITQEHNTKGGHVAEALSAIETPYWTLLDGDDEWCDDTKIQTALEMLEAHPEYVTFAHDTLYKDKANNSKKSLVHEVLAVKIDNPVILEKAPYLHTSSRIHRSVSGSREHLSKLENVGDLFMYYYFLDKGPLYYHDKIMSVYNISGSGSWSGLSIKEQTTALYNGYYVANKMSGYRHDDFFTNKVKNQLLLKRLKHFFGIALGWRVYMILIKVDFVEV